MGTLSFYKKLDLLNRVYIINYCKLELLDKTFIPELPNDLDSIDLKKSSYLNMQDSKLLVAVLPQKRIKFLVDRIILEIIKQDEQIALSSKTLRELKKYFSDKDIKLIVNSVVKSSEYSFFTTIIMTHGLTEIFYHLIKLIFEDIENVMGVLILDRFVPQYKLNKNLLIDLKKLPYENLFKLMSAVI